MKTDRIAGKTWRAICQSGLIFVLAAVAGLLMNQARSNTLPLVADWPPEPRLTADSGESLGISLEEAKREPRRHHVLNTA